MEISKCIKEARMRENLSQEDLAEQLSVSRQTISSWENGKSYPDIVSVIKMSDIFNVSLDKMLKEDKKLVNNMQEKMNTVESNKSIIFTILFAIIFFGGVYLFRSFVDIPKIDNLFLNIIMLIIFIVGVLTYLFSNIYVGKFLNQKTSNKTIVKTVMIMLLIISLFILFPLFEKITTDNWQIFGLRIVIIFILIIICLFSFRKIDKY